MDSSRTGNDLARSDEDIDATYSIVERLADAMRMEDDAAEQATSAETRARLVRSLYEGPKKCQCCINWVEEAPANANPEPSDDEDDGAQPLIVRHTVMKGEEKSQVSMHSIEICNSAVRSVLFDVFEGLDGIHPDVKYLIFMAPFRQFFWRWDAFEQAIEKQQNETVKEILLQLRAIVKRELAEAFAVSKELTRNGVIAFQYLWTLFAPGELLYSKFGGSDRFFILQSSRIMGDDPTTAYDYSLQVRYVDYSGRSFGYGRRQEFIDFFRGTKKITQLRVFPAKYLGSKLESAKQTCIARGKKFRDLAGGPRYKSYREPARRSTKAGPDTDAATAGRTVDQRIIVDADNHPVRHIHEMLKDPKEIAYSTGIITQTPIDEAPPGGHRPLPPPGWNNERYRERDMREYDDDEIDLRRRGDVRLREEVWRRDDYRRRDDVPIIRQTQRVRSRRRRSYDSLSSASVASIDMDEYETKELSDLQLQLCDSRHRGYSLKSKHWRSFDVDRIEDVEYNPAPFDSLVLPDGYKQLILSFVESQLKDGEAFDDVINGKGGGLVILLAGDPGVGKTLTAESVAERIRAPLYKMDLAQFIDDDDDVQVIRDNAGRRIHSNEDAIVTAFDLAAKWKAVLLIDECDLYLEKRSDASARRNRMVSRFLQELEYYPSLLFLTTNREKELDPAIQSRIHLTINYPPLNAASRRTIWATFLRSGDDLSSQASDMTETASDVTDAELDILAGVEINGRCIRNIAKTAGMMARRADRAVRFEDIRHVLAITEELAI